MPLLRQMVWFIKKWAKPLGLNDPGRTTNGQMSFSSYALTLMAIGHLQVRCTFSQFSQPT